MDLSKWLHIIFNIIWKLYIMNCPLQEVAEGDRWFERDYIVPHWQGNIHMTDGNLPYKYFHQQSLYGGAESPWESVM